MGMNLIAVLRLYGNDEADKSANPYAENLIWDTGRAESPVIRDRGWTGVKQDRLTVSK
jgi:hypothetical protein